MTALKDKIAASNPAVDYDEFHEVVRPSCSCCMYPLVPRD